MPHLGLDALVKASRAVNIPTRDARDQNRKGLAGRIAVGVAAGAVASGAREAAAAIAGGASASPVAGASTALAGGLVKWAVVSIVIAVGSAAGVGAYVARDHVSAGPGSSSAAAVATAASEPVRPSPRGAALLVPAPDSDPPPGSGALGAASPVAAPGESYIRSQPPAGTRSSTVQARSFERELRLLRSARRALDTGSPAQALALLDRYAAEFPQGTLKPECQAARVLALCAAGRVASAQKAREQFMEQQPGSPLAEGLRATCGGGP
jgi:hypothetical protein